MEGLGFELVLVFALGLELGYRIKENYCYILCSILSLPAVFSGTLVFMLLGPEYVVFFLYCIFAKPSGFFFLIISTKNFFDISTRSNRDEFHINKEQQKIMAISQKKIQKTKINCTLYTDDAFKNAFKNNHFQISKIFWK